jgi:hypothetical protein
MGTAGLGVSERMYWISTEAKVGKIRGSSKEEMEVH